MARRRRRGLWIALRLTVAGAAVFSILRLWGPSLVMVRGTSLPGIVESGEIVFARRFRASSPVGSVVFARPVSFSSTRADTLSRVVREREALSSVMEKTPSALVPRILLAFPGEGVRYTDRSVVVQRQPREYTTYTLPKLHPILDFPPHEITLVEDQFFAVGSRPGVIDSRVVGARNGKSYPLRAVAVVWPFDRVRWIDPARVLATLR